MGFLRIFGVIVALGLSVAAVRGFRKHTLRFPDTIIALVLSLGMLVVAAVPEIVDPLLRELGFPPGDARRVIGVLVLSNALTYFLLLRSFAKTDRLERLVGEYSDRMAARWFEHDHGALEGSGRAAPRGNGNDRVKGTLAVVIPALNEEDALPQVLASIPRQVEGLSVELIVVSDGSTDATETIAREHGALVVPRDLRRGQGAAVSLGYSVAVDRGASVVATLDGDGQHDAAELPQLIRPILEGEADVVQGSRMLGDYHRPMFGRAQGVKVFSWLISTITGTRITDPASGFRAFTPEALRKLTFRETQFHASEVGIAVPTMGLRLKEVPCTCKERSAGGTKKPPLLRYGYGYTRTLFRTWFGLSR